MRKKVVSFVLLIVIMVSFVACSTHKYDVREIEKKIDVTSLESREIYLGKEWGHRNCYFTLDSDKYKGIYFYLFDSSKEAKQFYDFEVNNFDNITCEENDYVIGDMFGGEVVDHVCIFVTDNMVVHINMSSDYFGEQGEYSHANSHDMNFIESFVEEW